MTNRSPGRIAAHPNWDGSANGHADIANAFWGAFLAVDILLLHTTSGKRCMRWQAIDLIEKSQVFLIRSNRFIPAFRQPRGQYVSLCNARKQAKLVDRVRNDGKRPIFIEKL